MDYNDCEKSKGHCAFYEYNSTKYELYFGPEGDLYKAPISNVIDVRNGYRIGRWEAPPWMAKEYVKTILA